MENVQVKNVQERIWSRDFLLIWLANFFIFLGFQMTLPTLPIYVKELGGTDQHVGIIVGIFMISALLIRPIAGHALESKGRGFVYIIGLAIFVLSIVSYGFIAGLFLLGALRIVQGVGWGLSTTAGGTIVTDLIPAHRRGEGLGYFGLSGNIALAFGPGLGLALVGVISFKEIFLICAGLGFVAFILSLSIRYKKKVDHTQQTKVVRFDVIEKSALKPAILLFFITATFGGISTFLPLHAMEQNVSGIELYFVVFAIFLMISRTFSGKIYDRKGHLYIFIPGACMIFVAMLLLAWLSSTATMLVAAGFYGLGFGMVQPALHAWAVSKAALHRKAMANATFFSFFDLGVGLAAVFYGLLASALNYTAIYLVSAFSIILSIFIYIYIVLREKYNENKLV